MKFEPDPIATFCIWGSQITTHVDVMLTLLHPMEKLVIFIAFAAEQLSI